MRVNLSPSGQKRETLLAAITNGGMLAATPIGGGHYFVDVLAGIAITILAIMAARALGRFAESPPRATAGGATVTASAQLGAPCSVS